MRFKTCSLRFAVCALAVPYSLLGASFGNKESQRDSSLQLRHELSNVHEQMQVLLEKIQNQEDIIEALKRDVDSSKKSNLEEIKGKQGKLDQKFTSQDSTIKGFAGDLKELKNHTNGYLASLQESDARIKDLEKIVQKQSESIEYLRSALTSLIEGVKGKEMPQESGSLTTYEVKSGDSLGLIAQNYKTSIKQIKELNKLKSDAIFKGQKLRIPG